MSAGCGNDCSRLIFMDPMVRTSQALALWGWLAGMMLAALTACGGCSAEWTTEGRFDRGLVVVLPGVEGVSALNLDICYGLAAGGLDWAIELRDWSGLLGPLGNQGDRKRNRKVAAEISEYVVAYQDEHPGRPVVLIGHSGGTAIAVWIAEAMPEGRQVDGVILLASSLSQGYNLIPALEKSSRGIVNFYSQRDGVLAGLSSSPGPPTMDGQHALAAGKFGFEWTGPGGTSWAYQRLYQIIWDKRMERLGHLGGHAGYTDRRFGRKVLAPLVMQGVWSQQRINDILVEALKPPPPATQPATHPATQATQPASPTTAP